MILKDILTGLMRLPGLAGYEGRVRQAIAAHLRADGIDSRTDRIGNLITTFPGNPSAPSVMVFAHMDQLGFVVRKIEDDGSQRLTRVGGVPERALASQPVLVCVGEGRDVAGVIGNMSHHATPPEQRHRVITTPGLRVDTGHSSREAASAAGIAIGTPVVYLPSVMELAGDRIAGTSVDDRAGCAVLIDLIHALKDERNLPTIHAVFSVQEEFNLRGAVVAAQNLQPDIAIQIDLMLATDTPDMADRGEMRLGKGPGISMYSFHGRGTLNGVIPHPALVELFEGAAEALELNLQRSAQTGVLTDLSYVQSLGEGVASIDVGFPMRYSHSSLEVCAISDLVALRDLLARVLTDVGAGIELRR
ncbi:MAG: M20/M25/M40 family metallo-hydrolase [Rhodobacteraceae bacterium]|nr:M20/M25/M40 family metallo-hydrolase [Paracoccaceae bacterium]